MSIALKDVEHLAGLSRISVSEDEKKLLQHDLEEILTYVSQVTKVVADIGEPEVGELRNIMRNDENPHDAGLFTEDILSQAPRREGNRVSVKKIL